MVEPEPTAKHLATGFGGLQVPPPEDSRRKGIVNPVHADVKDGKGWTETATPNPKPNFAWSVGVARVQL